MKIVFYLLLFISFLTASDFKAELFMIDKNGKKLNRIGYPAKTSVLILKNIQKEPKIIFNKKTYPAIKTKDGYISLISVNYRQKPGDYQVIIKEGEKTKTMFFRIKKPNYKKEFLKVDPKKVHLSKKDQKRVQKEYKEAIKIYSHFTPKKLWKGRFIYPINSKITSTFGNARVFNKSLKSYHSGVDFRAKVGTKIKASNNAKVVLAKNRFFAGNSVILDHGLGIYSCYYHLSKFKVKKNQKVKKGQIVGLSRKSGRVTAPHLHFSMRVNGVQVDPLQAIKTLNSINF